MTDERNTVPTFADRVAFERRSLARLSSMITPLLDPIDRGAVRYNVVSSDGWQGSFGSARVAIEIGVPPGRVDLARLILGRGDKRREGNRKLNALTRMLDSSRDATVMGVHFTLSLPQLRDEERHVDAHLDRDPPRSSVSLRQQREQVCDYLRLLAGGLLTTDEVPRMIVRCAAGGPESNGIDEYEIDQVRPIEGRDLTGRFIGAGGGNVEAMDTLCKAFARAQGVEMKPVVTVIRSGADAPRRPKAVAPRDVVVYSYRAR